MTDNFYAAIQKLITFKFDCAVTGPHDSLPNCQAHEYTTEEGYYLIELWGALGGDHQSAEGGHGGYVRGIISVKNNTKLYFFLGEKGFEGTTRASFTRNTFGFGGRGNYHHSVELSGGSSGGGMSWVTIGDNSIEHSILKAGGGGGAASYVKSSTTFDTSYAANGGHAGGLEGQSGQDAYDAKNKVALSGGGGGKQDSPGTNKYSSLANGDLNFGGNVSDTTNIAAGGGAGHYGGAAGYIWAAPGGGGSSWWAESVAEGKTLAGDQKMPSPDSNTYTTGRVGHGAARITFLSKKFIHCSDIRMNQYEFLNVLKSSTIILPIIFMSD